MRLLVTGGAGFIGSIVTRYLIDAGHQVVVFDNLERGHRKAVPADAELIVGDLRDPEATLGALQRQFDGVLHFAAFALVAESVDDPGLYFHNNVGGTLSLLNAMVACGTPRLVFSSTCAVYGQPATLPITESTPPRPTNPYGASKLAADHVIASFCAEHGVGAVSLRYFNVAGAHDEVGEVHEPETHLIPNLLRVALGQSETASVYGTDYPTADGTAIRDYLHVDDLATAHLLALDGTVPGRHRIFNLGTGTGYSVQEVIAAVEQVTGLAVPVTLQPRRPGDPASLVASPEKIRAELGWVPKKTSLAAMITDSLRFARKHPHGY